MFNQNKNKKLHYDQDVKLDLLTDNDIILMFEKKV